MAAPRYSKIFRQTKETSINCDLNLDGRNINISTPSGFFSHMLTALATYAGWGLTLEVTGDIQVDYHHTVEDTGIVLGKALSESLGDFSSHARFGSVLVPMDDALAEVALDAGRRPYLHFEAIFPQPQTRDFDFCLVEEFFRALTTHAGFTLHLTGRRGQNSHHLAEALFKGMGMACRRALAPREGGTLSTKGVL
ncbi:MAG: imidazoleglycerol-phosphate dehydratase HisB [Deltaproteobacteria bacterium]|jgi:imidazoleglycerol-phosphate dehydratase|nr:imidazoleglycerol-phosphate dehydratase HisB [Deltaproteobacteria bacterium]